MTNRVSIALATYNGERYLLEQLQSLADQTRVPDELVVSDDGSTDNSIAVVEKFAESAPFKVILLPNEGRLGYRRNFRRAANHCSSDLIAFCDQDDIWRPTKIARLEDAFADPSVLLAYHNANVFGLQSDRPLFNGPDETRTCAAVERAPFKIVCGLVQMFRAELCAYDDLWDQSVDHVHADQILAHDQWFFFLAHSCGRVRYLDDNLLDYRQHESNTCGSAPPLTLFQRLRGRLAHVGTHDLDYAQSAESRALVLRALEGRGHRLEVASAATMYDALARRYRRRAAVYLGSNMAARASALVGSLTAHDYGRHPTQFDPRSIVRELWSGVVRQQA